MARGGSEKLGSNNEITTHSGTGEKETLNINIVGKNIMLLKFLVCLMYQSCQLLNGAGLENKYFLEFCKINVFNMPALEGRQSKKHHVLSFFTRLMHSSCQLLNGASPKCHYFLVMFCKLICWFLPAGGGLSAQQIHSNSNNSNKQKVCFGDLSLEAAMDIILDWRFKGGGSRAILDWRFKGGGGAGQFWIGDLRVGGRAILDWRFKGEGSTAI